MPRDAAAPLNGTRYFSANGAVAETELEPGSYHIIGYACHDGKKPQAVAQKAQVTGKTLVGLNGIMRGRVEGVVDGNALARA